MNKIIFELSEVKITPISKAKLNIEIKFEPAKQNGIVKDLADRIIQCIDDYRKEINGAAKIKEINGY